MIVTGHESISCMGTTIMVLLSSSLRFIVVFGSLYDGRQIRYYYSNTIDGVSVSLRFGLPMLMNTNPSEFDENYG